MAEQTPNKPSNRRSGDRRVGPRSAPASAMWYVLGVMLLLSFLPLGRTPTREEVTR